MEAADIGIVCDKLLAEDTGNKSVVLNIVIDLKLAYQLNNGLAEMLGQKIGMLLGNRNEFERYESPGSQPVIPANFSLIDEFRKRVPILAAKFGYIGKRVFTEAFKQSYTPQGDIYFQLLSYKGEFLENILRQCTNPKFAQAIKFVSYGFVEGPTCRDEMQVLMAFNQGKIPLTMDGVFFSRAIDRKEDPKMDIALEILSAEIDKLANQYGVDIGFIQEEEDEMYGSSRRYSELTAVPYVSEYGVLSKRASKDFSDQAYRGFIYWNIANVIFLQELFDSVKNYEGFEKVRSKMVNGAKNACIDEVAVRVFGKLDEIVQFRTEYDTLDRKRVKSEELRTYNKAYLEKLQQLNSKSARELHRRLVGGLYG